MSTGERDRAPLQLLDQLHEVDGEPVVAKRPHGRMPLLVDQEEGVAPGLDAVQLRGVFRRPRVLAGGTGARAA